MNVAAPTHNREVHHEFLDRYQVSVQEMTRLANEGVGYLLADDSKGSLGCFARALAIAQAPVAPDLVNEAGQDLAAVNCSAIRLSLSTPVPGLTDVESHLYIQNQAIGFDLDTMMLVSAGFDDTLVETAHAMAATAILFNLALAYHHYGMTHQRVAMLRKACRFYRLCADNLIPALPSWTREQPGVILMIMGCRNNQAQIEYQYLANPMAASELSSQIQGEMAPRMELLHQNPLLSKQFGEILLNTNMLQNYSTMSAPVA